MNSRQFLVGVTMILILLPLAGSVAWTADDEKKPLRLEMRSQVQKGDGFEVVTKTVAWDPKKTAIIICDMWDDHWCKSAAVRVGEMAGPLNEVVQEASALQGVFIIHAPSSVTAFYKDTPQRKLAQDAPFAKTPVALATIRKRHRARCGAIPTPSASRPCQSTIPTWAAIVL